MFVCGTKLGHYKILAIKKTSGSANPSATYVVYMY